MLAGRRIASLLENDGELARAVCSAEDRRFIDSRRTCVEAFAAACARFAARPCVGTRGRALTYAQLWERVRALASGLRHLGLVRPGDSVGLCGAGSADWIVTDLACLYAGAVSVPLSPSAAPAELADVIAEAQVGCVVVARAQLARVAACGARTIVVMECTSDGASDGDGDARALADVEAHGRAAGILPPVVPVASADPLISMIYTSGSTGAAKGVPMRDRAWRHYLRPNPTELRLPIVSVSYLPLSHLLGRIMCVYFTLIRGGRLVFVSGSDPGALFVAARAVRPTFLVLIPRVSGLIYQHFQTQVRRRGSGDAAAVIAEMRNSFLGDRLCRLVSSSAPTPPEVLTFLHRCFAVPVEDIYATSETGAIAINGRALSSVRYRLEAVPELDYRGARGELVVQAPGGDWVRTGDIVEASAPGHLTVIARRHNVLRPAHGEFVNVSQLEELYTTRSPLIAQIYVHGDPRHAHLLAVIVPRGDADRPALRAELDRVARAANRPPHEVPRDFLVATAPFSAEDGLLTETGKPRRRALAARYGPALAAVFAEIAARQLAELPAGDVAARARAAVAVALGLDEADLAGDVAFVGLGGDSLSAARLCDLLREACGAAPPVADVLDPALTIAELVRRVAGGRLEPVPELLRAADLTLERFPELAVPDAPLAAAPPRAVLLTGATGFLGRALLGELLAAGVDVVCLARDPARVPAQPRVRALAGDLARPRLGLAADAHRALAEGVDAIVHAGAWVNHLVDYRQLHAPNVLGTVAIMELALSVRRKPVIFVSSTAVTAGLRRATPVGEDEGAAALWPTRPRAAGPAGAGAGYAASKWAAEVLLDELAARRGVPVAIFRCSLLLGGGSGAMNPDDYLTRLLVGIRDTGLAPRSFYAAPGPHHLDALAVDEVATVIARVATQGVTGHHRYHAANARRDDGVSLDTLVDWLESAGNPVTRVAPHAEWFRRFREALAALDEPRRRRSPLAMIDRWAHPEREPGPPLDTTAFRAALRAHTGADDVPPLDEALVHRCLQTV